MILTLTGASGAGKSTLANALLLLLAKAELSPGCTTRPMRPTETEADVIHLSRTEFTEMRERGKFLWTVEVHGQLYGTLRDVVNSGLLAPDRFLILVLTSEVLPILKEYASDCGSEDAIRSVYVLSPEASELRKRLSKREVDNKIIERRLNDCLSWDRDAYDSNLYDLLITGDGDVELNAKEIINRLSLV